MTLLFVITILLVALLTSYVLDFLFERKIDNLINRSIDLSDLYSRVLQSMRDGNIFVSYEGTFYAVTVVNLDYPSFICQLEKIVDDVMKSYDNIGDFFLKQMPDDLEETVYQLYDDIKNIKYSIRIVKWQYGIKN